MKCLFSYLELDFECVDIHDFILEKQRKKHKGSKPRSTGKRRSIREGKHTGVHTALQHRRSPWEHTPAALTTTSKKKTLNFFIQ